MANKPCLTCGTPSEGSRCSAHRRSPGPLREQIPYDRRHERLTKAAITQWVRIYGWDPDTDGCRWVALDVGTDTELGFS